MKHISSALVGAVFGLGIAISGMANPAKVLNFFDVFGTWDPSLIFVMGGAMLTAMAGYRIVLGRQPKPMFEHQFAIPTNKAIDMRLIAGSAVFGIGWGIAGFCPGGAIPALGLGYSETFVFVATMVAGLVFSRWLNSRKTVLSRA
ncbi:DUF6691 family protein [Pseudogemmobacter sp. W21_MBD1_M6]|uniref:DUF6691 family protein n=1 Tax=Pseudogemmobacter sp. W21_MBD1_M6 TaxID=3240271 RepID=UPI003F998969